MKLKKLKNKFRETLQGGKMDKDIIGKLEEIYKACDDERVWEIQKRLGELLKGLTENMMNKKE